MLRAELDAVEHRVHAIDRSAAVGFTDAIGRLSIRVANRPARPAWKETSFFKRFAASAASKTGN